MASTSRANTTRASISKASTSKASIDRASNSRAIIGKVGTLTAGQVQVVLGPIALVTVEP
jgi:hypothetical protein